MTLGTGLFFGAIFLGLVYLFVNTQDKWNWKKIAFFSVIIPISILIVLLGGLRVSEQIEYAFPKQLAKQDGMNRVKIGMSKDEVLYVRGQPTQVLGALNKTSNGYKWREVIDALSMGSKVKEYDSWQYLDAQENYLTIDFDLSTSKVTSIDCRRGEESIGVSCNIEGLMTGTSEENAIKMLGKPENYKFKGNIKILYYPSKNLEIYLEKEEVKGIIISNNIASNIAF